MTILHFILQSGIKSNLLVVNMSSMSREGFNTYLIQVLVNDILNTREIYTSMNKLKKFDLTEHFNGRRLAIQEIFGSSFT